MKKIEIKIGWAGLLSLLKGNTLQVRDSMENADKEYHVSLSKQDCLSISIQQDLEDKDKMCKNCKIRKGRHIPKPKGLVCPVQQISFGSTCFEDN